MEKLRELLGRHDDVVRLDEMALRRTRASEEERPTMVRVTDTRQAIIDHVTSLVEAARKEGVHS